LPTRTRLPDLAATIETISARLSITDELTGGTLRPSIERVVAELCRRRDNVPTEDELDEAIGIARCSRAFTSLRRWPAPSSAVRPQ